MSRFITKDDIWGIKQAIRILWDRECGYKSSWSNGGGLHSGGDKEIEFNAFYNQQVPEAWRETLATVKRHAEEIKELASNPQYQGLVWFKRNGQINSGYLNHQLVNEIKYGELELPTYMEIEEEKQRWQSHDQYQGGRSQPIREELIQIRMHR